MKVRWLGGPLDGATDDLEMPVSLTWYGPDVVDPNQKILVYIFHSQGEYWYDQVLTDLANQWLVEQRDLQSESGGTNETVGGQSDGTRGEREDLQPD